jgi:hypothetical protein
LFGFGVCGFQSQSLLTVAAVVVGYLVGLFEFKGLGFAVKVVVDCSHSCCWLGLFEFGGLWFAIIVVDCATVVDGWDCLDFWGLGFSVTVVGDCRHRC